MPKLVRIHFYFGPQCRSEVIDQEKPFSENFTYILSLFDVAPEHYPRYMMKLNNGGSVERNEVLFHDDRVMILPKPHSVPFGQEMVAEELDEEEGCGVKKELEEEGKEEQGLLPAPPQRDVKSIIQKMEEQKKVAEKARKPKKEKGVSLIKYKQLLKRKLKREEEGGQRRIEENMDDGNDGDLWTQDNVVKKIDYDSLDLMLYKKQIQDYHMLIDLVNIWAVGLGFLVKLKRSPKINADGSQTMRLYCSTSVDGKQSCKFAITFKQDEKTSCWLLYQEYLKDCMQHNHPLERRRFFDIKDYIDSYRDKVANLNELKDMIYEKFGLVYTLNQIHYFKGRWTGEALVVEKEVGEDDSLCLAKLLRKNSEDYLEVETGEDGAALSYLFYSNLKMKESFMRHPDVLFFNKRFTQNRFKKPMLMAFAVGSNGKSLLVAMALLEKEETTYFNKVAQSFLKAMGGTVPKTVVIERQLKLFAALRENFQTSNILFCYYHIQRTFKQQYQFMEKDRSSEYQKIVELPIIESEAAFEAQLAEVNAYSFQNEYHRLIVQKLTAEKKLWPKFSHLKFFTAGISVCQRNEQIKQYLKPVLKKRECAVSEALKRIFNVDNKEFKLTHEFQKVSQKHEQVFKVAHFLNYVVKDQCTQYAFQRMKWNVAKGFRFEIREEKEDEFVLSLKQSSSSKKHWQQQQVRVQKRVNGAGQKGGVCECLESNNSGFPCPHLCLLNYKGRIDYMDINQRWFKQKDNKKAQGGEVKAEEQVNPENALEDVDVEVEGNLENLEEQVMQSDGGGELEKERLEKEGEKNVEMETEEEEEDGGEGAKDQEKEKAIEDKRTHEESVDGKEESLTDKLEQALKKGKTLRLVAKKKQKQSSKL